MAALGAIFTSFWIILFERLVKIKDKTLHYFEDKQAFVVGTGYNELSFDDYGAEKNEGEAQKAPLLEVKVEEKELELQDKKIDEPSNQETKQEEANHATPSVEINQV